MSHGRSTYKFFLYRGKGNIVQVLDCPSPCAGVLQCFREVEKLGNEADCGCQAGLHQLIDGGIYT